MIIFMKYLFLTACISGFFYWFMVMSEGCVKRNPIKAVGGLFGVGCTALAFAVWNVIDWQSFT